MIRSTLAHVDPGALADNEITVSEMAARIGSIPYELLCRVGTRIERIYNQQRP